MNAGGIVSIDESRVCFPRASINVLGTQELDVISSALGGSAFRPHRGEQGAKIRPSRTID